MSDRNTHSKGSAGGGPQAPSHRMSSGDSSGLDGLLPGVKYRVGVSPKNSGNGTWEDGLSPRAIPAWLVLVGIFAVILFSGAVIWALWLRSADGTETRPRATFVPEERFDPGEAEDWKGPVPEQIAELFSQAKTHEERLKWVRNPEKVAPMMESFFRDGPGASEKVTKLTPMSPAKNGVVAFQRFQVSLSDGRSRLLCVVLSEEGGKVDFECYARHGSATWDELLAGKAAEHAEVRVFLEPGYAYMYEYADEPKWRNYLATTPDYEYPLNFYVLRGSPEEKKLEEMLADGPMRATLAIRSVNQGHEKKQFEVSEVLAAGWVR